MNVLLKLSHGILIGLVILFPLAVKSENIVVLNDTREEYLLDCYRIQLIEDQENKWDITRISAPEFARSFEKCTTLFPEFSAQRTTYWMRFTIQNNLQDTKWILESYNFRFNLIEVYIPDGNGGFTLQKTGSALDFHQRSVQHKNLSVVLPSLSPRPQTCYVKLVSYQPGRIKMNIRSFEKFTSYALSEYYLLGIFYGMIIIIGLYNLFIFVRLKDTAYLYYSLYAFSVGLFSMTMDGTAFQYLWPQHPEINPDSFYLTSTLMMVFLLMYTKSFLETATLFPLLNKLINWTIMARIFLVLLRLTFFPELVIFIWIDVFAFVLAYTAAIIAYKRGNYPALYFVLGFSVLFIGNTINLLRMYTIINSNIFTVYSLNVSAIIEMLLLSLALAEKVKKSRENEIRKENLNRELEEKVKERTEALMIQNQVIEEKVRTLDTFIYKASHDIKGPLKSLIGVATLGLQDHADNARIYFEHTLKTARKLDAILKDLLHITKITNAPVALTEIGFQEIADEVLETLKNLPGFEKINFKVNIDQDGKFYSERALIYSIFQNFIENGIKYRDTKKNSFMQVRVKATQYTAEIKFIDNGIGIPAAYQEKVFDMFFRIDNESEDSTGLGLYIVKLSVEKLGGQIFLKSTAGEGTTFSIVLRNHCSIVQ